MTPAIEDTLLQLFGHVRQDPNTLPAVSVEDWQEGSVEWQMLMGFQSMLEQLQQLREQEELYRSIFEATYDGVFIADHETVELSRLILRPARCMDIAMTR